MRPVHQPNLKRSGTAQRPRNIAVFPTVYKVPFLLTVIIFFVWGMSNNLTDILVQQFRKSFSLSLLQAELVQTAVFLAYGTMAIPAAIFIKRFGYKSGLVVGLVVFGLGTLSFWPASLIGRYLPFLLALFVIGCGSSILETTANPLIAQFGDLATSEQRLNFAQAFNPPGTIAGVLIGTWFIFSGVEKNGSEIIAMQADGTYSSYMHTELLRVVPTYIVMGFSVLILAFAISRTKFPSNVDSETPSESSIASASKSTIMCSLGRVLNSSALRSAIVAQFFYVGSQVCTWSTLIPYMRAYTRVNERTAAYFLTGSLVMLAVGRIISTPLMRYIRPVAMIGVYAGLNVLLLCVTIVFPGLLGSCAIVATSYFMSVMYPTIFALGVKGLGPDTKLGGSLLVMSIVGGALFPPLLGWITKWSGSIAAGYTLPTFGYIVVASYAFLQGRKTPFAEPLHSS